MQLPNLHSSTCLPLSWRLRRAILVALLLGLWAPFKIVWEQDIARQQDLLRYGGVTMTRQLRDQLGQGLTIGVLSGMRNVVADLVWLQVTTEWMNNEWFKMGAYINLCTALQPRATVFWEMGGWHLAWNCLDQCGGRSPESQSEPAGAEGVALLLVDRGAEIYKRGLENNPQYWRLWMDLGQLYDQRLKDYPTAADYYQKASEQPNAPIYLERAGPIMFDIQHANEPVECYARWKALWERLTPEERTEKAHTPERVEKEIRILEQKLSIPKEKRVFPN